MVALFVMPWGCARVGRLTYVRQTLVPAPADSTARLREARPQDRAPWSPIFGDSLIGIAPGTADTATRFLGRLRAGYTADTLHVILFGDNRPGFRITRLAPQWYAIRRMFSLNPAKFFGGLVAIPVGIVRGLWPDLALIREIPERIRNTPHWGREQQVMRAILTDMDSLHARGQEVSAVINTGDLVYDGRYPRSWQRFLNLNRPITSRAPYFPVAGNHERTDTVEGVENWRVATGLPVGGDRLYYCFDSADGWVRFLFLDTNPIVDPANHWTREVQVRYSKEQFDWLVARVKEHTGPVMVVMHHPPFSAGLHHMEWQNDSVLVKRRDAMVRALHESGIGIIAGGHQHGYQRALLTWPDAVLVTIVTGGGGAPLHNAPVAARAGELFSEYKVAGSVVKPENVFSANVYHFTHLRFWFGGGDLRAYSVDEKSKATKIDEVKIDLTRYGIPKIDQHKIPLPMAKGPKEPTKHEPPTPTSTAAATAEAKPGAKVDTTSASTRLLSKPAPGKKPVRRKPAAKPAVKKPARAKVDSTSAVMPAPPKPAPTKTGERP